MLPWGKIRSNYPQWRSLKGSATSKFPASNSMRNAYEVYSVLWDQHSDVRPVMSQDFSWFQDYLQISLCLQMFVKEEKYQPRKEYCVQTCIFMFLVMWSVCKSSKIKHPEGVRGFDQVETQTFYPFFMIFYFCQITPAAYSSLSKLVVNVLFAVLLVWCVNKYNLSPSWLVLTCLTLSHLASPCLTLCNQVQQTLQFALNGPVPLNGPLPQRIQSHRWYLDLILTRTRLTCPLLHECDMIMNNDK